MLRRSSKSATPLQSAVTKNTSVNRLECAHTNSLDLKSSGMNSYKKGWGYPLAEAPVRPSKTKTSGFRSRRDVSCVMADFAEPHGLQTRVASPRAPMLTCAEHILGGLSARCGTWVCAGRIYGERGWLSRGDCVGG